MIDEQVEAFLADILALEGEDVNCSEHRKSTGE
jgi:hypothetical protein